MKYKVGDKVRVRRGLKASLHYGGVLVNSGMAKKEIVTIASVCALYYKIKEDSFCWTDEMCNKKACSDCKLSSKNNGMGINCGELEKKHPDKVVEVLKQYKKDNEIETEYVWYVQIVEVDTHILKHEEPLKSVPVDEMIAKILKKWCSEHEGKYYAISERRCVVKE